MADRAASIRAERKREQSRGKPRTGARGRAARVMVAIPWIARRWEWQVEGRPADCELMRAELAEDDRAGSAQSGDDVRVGYRTTPYYILSVRGCSVNQP